MRAIQSLPRIWLVSDARNDSMLESALTRLPRESGFIFRHYHLAPQDRFARFLDLRRVARVCGHTVILADSAQTAREWGADGIYGAARSLAPRRRDILQLATAHSLREIGEANRMGADAVLLSPAFPTRSHPGAPALGPVPFRLMATHARMPVIALGGMSAARARALHWPRWAAIDGLTASIP